MPHTTPNHSSLGILSLTALLASAAMASDPSTWSWFKVSASDNHIHYVGRTYAGFDPATNAATTMMGWSGTSASITFQGTAIQALITANAYGTGIDSSWYKVFVDGVETANIAYKDHNSDTAITLAENLSAGTHTVTLYKRTEVQYGSQNFNGFWIHGDPSSVVNTRHPVRKLQFLGNSITCGYGALDHCTVNSSTYTIEGDCPAFTTTGEDHYYTYAAVAARTLGAEDQTVCWSGKGVFRNTAFYPDGPTIPEIWEYASPLWETADPAATETWNHAGWVPDAVVINLGTNDYSYTTPPDSAQFETTYKTFVQRIKAVYPNAPVILLDGPMMSNYYPFTGAADDLRKHLNNIVAQLGGDAAKVYHLQLTENQSTTLGVGADWHPNKEQHALNAQQLITKLTNVLGWSGTPDSTDATPIRKGTNTGTGLLSVELQDNGTLSISMPSMGTLSVELWNLDGSSLGEVYSAEVAAGEHTVNLPPASAMGPGTKIVRVRAGSGAQAVRLITNH